MKNNVFSLGNDQSLECVDKFCYLGAIIAAGVELRKHPEQKRHVHGQSSGKAPILTSRGASLKVKGKIYKACIQGVLIFGNETWPMKVEDMQSV